MPKSSRGKGDGAREFVDRLDQLDKAVGRGTLELGIVVDQRYAKYQHERMDLKHPQGGKSHYLSDPLYALAPAMLSELARSAITAQGSDLEGSARTQVERWARASRVEAPKWFGDLANSHAPYVADGEQKVYERPAKARRLSEEELELKNRWRVHPSRRGRRR